MHRSSELLNYMANLPAVLHSRTRPTRFLMHLPLKYRYSGSPEWHSGTTENVSASGVLFRGRHKMERFAPIELTMRLPNELVGQSPVTVLANGYIVRTTDAKLPLGRAGFAAAVANYRLVDEKMEAQFMQWLLSGAVHGVSPGFLHTMNNLLTVVIGNAELLLMDASLNDDNRMRLSSIKTAAESAGGMIRHMAEEKQK